MAGQQQFSATIDKWVAETEQRIEAVWKASAIDLVAEAQKTRGEGGNMRVDTGFLRASIRVSLSGIPPMRADAPKTGQTYTYTPQAIALVIAGAELGQTIYIGWTANYAAAREYGANGQPPDGFVRLAAVQWQVIVNRNAAKLRASAGPSSP